MFVSLKGGGGGFTINNFQRVMVSWHWAFKLGSLITFSTTLGLFIEVRVHAREVHRGGCHHDGVEAEHEESQEEQATSLRHLCRSNSS